jgi:nuclear factor erythroid 2-related factor 1/3
MYDRLSSFSGSNYAGVEGATGGHDDVFSPSTLKKEVPDAHYPFEDFGFSEEGGAAAALSGNDSDYKVPLTEQADPRHVGHNHTYPLAPGQQPRERKLTAEERRATAQMTRDEKKCRAMKIPFSLNDIIHSPVDEFNELLTKVKLNDAQLQLIRDVRRRGKNKVAAQNCRKRKMEVIQSLEDEVNQIRQEKERLAREKSRLHKSRAEVKDKYNQLYQEVFRSLRDENGLPYDPERFVLQHMADGNVFLLPRNTTAPPPPPSDHDDKPMHKRKGKKSR